MSCRLALLIPATLLLAGCLNEPIGQRDPALGESVRYDAALQTINPDPVYPEGSAQPGSNGDKAARAVKRYREGQIKQIEMLQTTGGASGGATGGGDSGGAP